MCHDVAIQKLPVVFCIDRAGVVGADGPTHHGAYDVAYMRSIPNVIISSPLNEQDLRDMMFTASEYDEAAWAIRYPRGASTGMEVRQHFQKIEIGKGICIQEGEEIAVLSFGPIGKYVTEASVQLEQEDIRIGYYDMRYAKPLDVDLIDDIYKNIHIITLGWAKLGGFGSAVAEYLAEKILTLTIMGLQTVLADLEPEELHAEVGMDAYVSKSCKAEISRCESF